MGNSLFFKKELRHLLPSNQENGIQVEYADIEDRVKALILNDLLKVNWQIKINSNKIEVLPPKSYDKQTIVSTMSVKRREIIDLNKEWIFKHLDLARENLASGPSVLKSSINPVIEVCHTQDQHDLFRIYRYYWSSPYSDYVGRRIKLIIRDCAIPNNPVIGIAALGSPIIHIPERDDFIGWDKQTRTKNLVFTMDAYVAGALPPYNHLLGGKLISYILASKEVRQIYERKYSNKLSIISKRKSNQLAGIFTTSLYGKSSQYNRIKYNDVLLYKHIGFTRGYGTLHLSDMTISAMIELLKSKGIFISHRFGEGPSWVMRIIRATGDVLGFNSDILLQHSFKRAIYFVPYATNYREFLNSTTQELCYYDYSINELVSYWKRRWLENRKKSLNVVTEVMKFTPENFIL